jgi:Xaa-Pro aminopeptidase
VVNRIQLLKKSFEKNELDAYIVTDETNMFYFTGFEGGARLLVPADSENILFVYGVNYDDAKATVKNCNVEPMQRGDDLNKKVADQCKKLKTKRVGFDSLDVASYLGLKKNLKKIQLKTAGQAVWDLRKVKDDTELHNMRKAAELTDAGAKAAVEALKPGIREYELAAEVEYAMRKLGSDGTAFETIIASGLRSAFPHGGCTSKKVGKGELIQFDIGARYQHYAADLTRTFLIGKPTPKQQKMYQAVMEAQEKAFQKIQEGAKGRLVDAAAREIIKKHGFGQNFPHGLGHGVGLAVHELPTLSNISKDILKAGNIVTNEPGVYVVGYGGVRVEDTVLVKKDGAERLTKASYELPV